MMEWKLCGIHVIFIIFFNGNMILCVKSSPSVNQSAARNRTDGQANHVIKKDPSLQNISHKDEPFEVTLKERILSIDNKTMPKSDNDEGVHVYLSMQFMRIDEISEKGQSFTSKLILREKWNNPAFTWKPEDYGNITEILVPREKIWSPAIHLFNGARTNKVDKDATHIQQHLMVMVDYQGNCTLTYTDFYKSTCEIDVTYFPFDEQTCKQVFGSWNFDERYLKLKVDDSDALGDRSEYETNGEWEMAHAFLREERVKYRLNKRYHSIVALHIHVERKYFFYMMNLVIPCALIACMIFLVFLLPPKSGERISLGITVLLSMAIFQELSSEKLPSSSDTFPLLGIYYTISIFEIGMAMALNCLVLNFYHRNQRMSPFIRKLLLGKLAKFLRVETKERRFSNELQFDESLVELDSSFSKAISSNTVNLGQLSQISNEKEADKAVMSRIGSMRSSIKDRGNHDEGAEETNMRSNSPLLMRRASKKRSDGGALGNGVGKKSGLDSKRNAEEWKDAAKVLDRLLLAISIIIGVVSASAIFMQSERFRRMVFFRN